MVTTRISHPMLVLFIAAYATIPAIATAQKVARLDTIVTFSRTGVAKLELKEGDIHVTTWDSNAVRVVAHARAGSTLNFDVSERRLSLTLVPPSGRSDSARYEVTLPAGTRLELSATSGKIVVVGKPGDVEAHTISGKIAVSGGQHVALKTRSGAIQVSGATGDVKVSSVNGPVLIEKATGAVEGETVSGKMIITGARARRMHLSSTSGLISYTGTLDPEGRYKLESHSGRVEMSLPEDVRTSMEVTTFSGKVVNEFRNAVQFSAKSGTKKTPYRYTIGGPGGGEASITTFSGTVVIGPAMRIFDKFWRRGV